MQACTTQCFPSIQKALRSAWLCAFWQLVLALSILGPAQAFSSPSSDEVPSFSWDEGLHDLSLETWYFWPKQLLEAKDLQEHPELFAQALRSSQRESWELAFPGRVEKHDVGTYLLRLRLDGPKGLWGLRFLGLGSAAELELIDHPERIRNGTLGKSRANEIFWWKRSLLPIATQGGQETITLLIRTSNFNYRIGGMTRPITLGPYAQLLREEERTSYIELFTLGMILILCLSHVLIAATNQWDRSNLYFAIFAGFTFVRKFVTGRTLENFLDPSGHVAYAEISSWFEYLGILMIPYFVLRYIQVLFPLIRFERLLPLFNKFTLLALSLHVCLPLYAYRNEFLLFYFFYAVITLFLGCTHVVYAGLFGSPHLRKQAWIMVGLFLICGFAMGADMLSVKSANKHYTEQLIALFFVGQSAIVAAALAEQSRQTGREQSQRMVLQRRLKSELQTRIAIVADLAHRTNNPLHAASLACLSAKSGLDQLSEHIELIFDTESRNHDPEVSRLYETMSKNLSDMREFLTQIQQGNERSTHSIADIRVLSGVDGYVSTKVSLLEVLRSTFDRLQQDRGLKIMERLVCEHFSQAEAYLLAQKSVLIYAFDAIFQFLLVNLEGPISLRFSWSLERDRPQLSLQLNTNETLHTEAKSELLSRLETMLLPYGMIISWPEDTIQFYNEHLNDRAAVGSDLSEEQLSQEDRDDAAA